MKIDKVLIGETKGSEHTTKYWIEYYEPRHPKYGWWALFKQGDWCWEKPEPTNLKEIRRVGLMEACIKAMDGHYSKILRRLENEG